MRFIPPASALGSRSVTDSRHVPPATKRADRASARSERPRRSGLADTRHEELEARSSCWPEAASGSSSRSLTGSCGRRGSSWVSRPEAEVERQQAGWPNRSATARGEGLRARPGCLPSRSRTSGRAWSSGRERNSRTGSGARNPGASSWPTTTARERRGRAWSGGGVRRKAAGRSRDADASQCPPHLTHHSLDVAPVQPRPGGEKGGPRAIGLDGRADGLEPVEDLAPELAHALGSGGTSRRPGQRDRASPPSCPGPP